MPSKTTPKPRYPLPEVLEPESDWCVMLKVPAHLDYLTTLITQLRYLTFSNQFERDDTATGAATVSRRWDTALFSEPITIVDCEGDMAFDMRVKPGQPWITQVSTDSGATWHDAIIQPHWESGGLVIPPVEDTQQAVDNAAAIVRQFWQSLAQQMLDDLNADVPRADTVNAIQDSLGRYGAGADIRTAIEAAYDAFAGAEAELQTDATTDCLWYDVFQAMRDFIESQSSNFLERLPDWLGDLPEILDGSIKQTFAGVLLAMGASPAWNYIINNGGVPQGVTDFAILCDAIDYEGITYRIVGPEHFELTADTGYNVTECDKFPVSLLDGEKIEACVMSAYLPGIAAPYRYIGFTSKDIGCDDDDPSSIFSTLYETLTPCEDCTSWYGLRDASGSLPLEADLDGFLAAAGMAALDIKQYATGFTAEALGPGTGNVGVDLHKTQIGGPEPGPETVTYEVYVIISTGA